MRWRLGDLSRYTAHFRIPMNQRAMNPRDDPRSLFYGSLKEDDTRETLLIAATSTSPVSGEF